jgi:uncharacterized protein
MITVLQALQRAARPAIVAAALFGFASAAYTQPKPTAAALTEAHKLIVVTGTTNLFNPLVAGVIEQAKLLFLQQDPSLAQDLNEVALKLRTDLAPRLAELSDEVAKFYAADFSEQELKDILAFYQTPAGKKLLERQPQIVDHSMKFAQEWANKLSDEVIAKMRDEMKKKGHAL